MRAPALLLALAASVASAKVPPALFDTFEAAERTADHAEWLDADTATRCITTLEAGPSDEAPPEDCVKAMPDTILGVSADGGTVAQWEALEFDGCGEPELPHAIRLLPIRGGKAQRLPLASACAADESYEACRRRQVLAAWRATRDLAAKGYRALRTDVAEVAWGDADTVHLNAPLARLDGRLFGYYVYVPRGQRPAVELVAPDRKTTWRLGTLVSPRAGETRPSVHQAAVVGDRLLVAVGFHDGEHCSAQTVVVTALPLPKGVTPAPPRTSPERGGTDALVELVQVSDFQCPFCARVEPTLDALLERYGAELRIVHKQNPLSFHNRALPAAIAALAAHRQGRYDGYAKRLYQNQKALEDADLLRYAQDEGLDLARFQKDVADPSVEAQVLAEQRAAVALGRAATPTFLSNGKALDGARPLERFVEAIDAELEAARTLRATGLSPAAVRAQRIRQQLGDNAPTYFNCLLGDLPAPDPPPKEEKGAAEPPEAPGTWRVPLVGTEPRLGATAPRVTVVTFMDLQCPFCARHLPNLERLVKDHPEVAVVFKHLPLAFHDRALPAARAAEAAHAQGAFWPFVRAVYANPSGLDDAGLDAAAQAAGLNLERFHSDKGRGDAALQADARAATDANARGTPTTFINGRLVAGAVGYDALETIVKAEKAKADALVAGGVAPAAVYEQVMRDAKLFELLAPTVSRFTTADRPRLGPADAPVQLVAFIGYKCPYSKRFDAEIREVMETPELAGKVALTYLHYPLTSHANSRDAARAAIAAAAQGRFWEAHAALFAQAEHLTEAPLRAALEKVGVDLDRLEATLSDPATETMLARDTTEAEAAAVKGTPQLYVNGRQFLGNWTDRPSVIRALTQVLPKR